MDTNEELEALTQFLYMAPTGLAQTDSDGTFLMVNPICSQLLMPLSPDGDLSNLFDALQDVAPDLRAQVSQFTEPHGMICQDMQIAVTAGVPGKSDPQVLSLSLLKLDEQRMMAVLSDITVSVKRERELQQSEAWFNAIFAGVSDYALMRLDSHGQVESGNETVRRLTGFSDDQIKGQPYSVFYPSGGITAEHVTDRLHEADKSGWSLDEGWRVKTDGTRFWGSCLIAPLERLADACCPLAEQGAGYSLIVRDITEKRSASEALRRAVSCDHLTGLANRRAFFQAAELEMQRRDRAPRPLSIIAIDADHFKSINDRYGHAIGDEVLQQLAGLMTGFFREVDIVARFGGEEFMVLLPGIAQPEAIALANRLCVQVSTSTVASSGQSIKYSVSAGVATMTPGTSGLDEMIKQADTALYAAKAAGRNQALEWQESLSATQTRKPVLT